MEVNFYIDQYVESFVGVNFWTCLFTLINLLLLFFIMKKLLFKPVKNMIDSRQKEVDDMYADANADRDAAEKMRAEYETKLARTNAESEAILKEAHRRALLRGEEIIRDAQSKAEATKKRAEEQIELEKKHAMNEIKDEVSEMAVGIAAAVLERDIKAEEHSKLIDSFIDSLGDEND